MSIPDRYLSGLSGEERRRRAAEIKRGKKTASDDKSAYSPSRFKTDEGKKTKTSKYTKRGRKLLAGSDAKTKNDKLAVLAKKTGYSTETLQKVYDRGLAAWRTGHRPGASQHAWAMARVYSFVTGGKTTKTADKDLVREAEIHFMTIERQLRRKYSDRLVEISIRGMSSKFIAGRARQWATKAAGAAQADRIVRGGKGITVSRDVGGAGGGRFVSQIQQAQQARANAIKAQRKASRLRKGSGARLSFGDPLFSPAIDRPRTQRTPSGERRRSAAERVGDLFGPKRDVQVKSADYFVGSPDTDQPRVIRFGPELLDDLTEARGSYGREAERMLQIRFVSEKLGVPFAAKTPAEAEKHLRRMQRMNPDKLAMALVKNGEYSLTKSGKVPAKARGRVKEMLSSRYINVHASHHEHAYNKYAEAWNNLVRDYPDQALEFASFYPEARQFFQQIADAVNNDPRTLNKVTWQQAVMVAAVFSPLNPWTDSYNLNDINWKQNVGQAVRALRDYARRGQVGGSVKQDEKGRNVYSRGYGFASLTRWRIENAQKILTGQMTPADFEQQIERAFLNKEGVPQKVPSFALNLLGFEHHFTDDRFMNALAFSDFPGFTGESPKSTENKFDYPATRSAAQRIAAEMGWPVEATATIQAMLWGYQRDIVEGGNKKRTKTRSKAVRRVFTQPEQFVPAREAATMRTMQRVLEQIYDPDADIEQMRDGIGAMLSEFMLEPEPQHQRFSEQARLRDPKGGLTAAGRAYFKRKEGANLKPGVKGAADTPEKMRRKGSFLTRFYTNPSGPMVRPNGKPSRLALAAAAWGEPVPKTAEDARRLAAKGRRLLAAYERSKKKKA